MAQLLVYIRGISHRGFRVKNNTGSLKVCKKGVNVQVDLNDDKTKKILSRERDNFVVVAGSGSTTAILQGLQGVATAPAGGLRVRRNSDSAFRTLYQKGTAQTVNLDDGRVLRQLRRSPGRYVGLTGASDTTTKIRGLQTAQLGFVVPAAGTVVLTSDNTNVSNNDTVVIGGKTYTFKTNLSEARATAVLTSDNTNVSDGDTVTINGKTYRFKTVIAAINDIHIGGSADASLTNLASAINGAGTAGTDYFTGTTGPTNVTSSAVASHALTLTAAVGTGTAANAYTSTETAAHLSFGGATFTGGIAPVINEVHIGASADLSLTNLASAINGTGGTVGTDYSSTTVADLNVTSSAVASHALTLTSINGGQQTQIAVSETSAHLSFGAATLIGLNTKLVEGVSATVNLNDAKVRALLRRHYKSWVRDTN